MPGAGVPADSSLGSDTAPGCTRLDGGGVARISEAEIGVGVGVELTAGLMAAGLLAGAVVLGAGESFIPGAVALGAGESFIPVATPPAARAMAAAATARCRRVGGQAAPPAAPSGAKPESRIAAPACLRVMPYTPSA